jgi:hypothetical protein
MGWNPDHHTTTRTAEFLRKNIINQYPNNIISKRVLDDLVLKQLPKWLRGRSQQNRRNILTKAMLLIADPFTNTSFLIRK